jgi:hypothetical protein
MEFCTLNMEFCTITIVCRLFDCRLPVVVFFYSGNNITFVIDINTNFVRL